MKAYACYNTDVGIRMQSSSGGVFTLLALYTIKRSGIVYGVTMSEDCYSAVFTRITNENDICKLRGSKYLQAKVGNTFRIVKQDLDDGRLVLFSGTGCQINGLKNYLKNDYVNLICVDVVCHGTPSPALWKKYAEHQEKAYGKLIEVNFRCKNESRSGFGIRENQQYISKDKDSFMQMFLRDYCLRPSCYECVAKEEKKSDITIADFWGVQNIAPEMNDGMGISLILVRTGKGQEILDKIETQLQLKEISYNDAVKFNPSEYRSVTRPSQRDYFFLDMNKMIFEELEGKYAAPISIPFFTKVKHKIKRMIKAILRIYSGINWKANGYGLLLTFKKDN